MEFISKDIPKLGRSKYDSTASSVIYNSTSTGSSGSGNSVYVYNGLDSVNSSWALSANMGKWLQDSKADKTELHLHTNLSFLDMIDQNLSKTSNPLFSGLNLNDYVGSPDYISGVTGKGWKIGQTFNQDGSYGKSYGELDFLTVRNSFTATEFLLNQVRATNGSLVISDSAKIKSRNGYEITVNGEAGNMLTFQAGDVLICQKWTGTDIKKYKLSVISTNALTFQFTVLEGSVDYIKEGDTLVRWTSTTDNNRKGTVYLTASQNNSPFIDAVYDGVTKARFGRLDGIVADGSPLSGYGIYCENGYFKGQVIVTGGNVATKEYVTSKTAQHFGEWQADKSYIKNAIVTYNHCTWMALNDVPVNYKPDTEYVLSSLGRYLYSGDAALGIGIKNWELVSERDYSKILGYTDYTDMIAKAEAGQTIISGGYINTNLINTNALIVNGGLATASDLNTALNPYLKSETVIEGGYIKSGLIDVNAVVTDSMLANKLTAVDIVTNKLTANEGSKLGNLKVTAMGSLVGANHIFEEIKQYHNDIDGSVFDTAAFSQFIINNIGRYSTFLLKINSNEGTYTVLLPTYENIRNAVGTLVDIGYGFTIKLIVPGRWLSPGGWSIPNFPNIDNNATFRITSQTNAELYDNNFVIKDYLDISKGDVLELYGVTVIKSTSGTFGQPDFTVTYGVDYYIKTWQK